MLFESNVAALLLSYLATAVCLCLTCLIIPEVHHTCLMSNPDCNERLSLEMLRLLQLSVGQVTAVTDNRVQPCTRPANKKRVRLLSMT